MKIDLTVTVVLDQMDELIAAIRRDPAPSLRHVVRRLTRIVECLEALPPELDEIIVTIQRANEHDIPL